MKTPYSKIRSLLSKPNRLSQAVAGWGGTVIFTSIVVTAVLVGARQIGVLQNFELSAFDQLMRWRPDEGPDQRLLILGITEEDLLREYPISDQTIAKVLDTLQQYKPHAIGLDIFREIPRGNGRAELAKSLKQPNISIVCKISQSENPGVPPPPELAPEQVGFADVPEDRGGTLRRSVIVAAPPTPETPWQKQHLCNDPSQQLVSFAFQLSLFYLQAQGIEPEQTEDEQIKIGSTVFKPLEEKANGYQNVEAQSYQILINYRSPKQVSEVVSLGAVLDGKLKPDQVRDRIVLIGYVAPSIKDDYYTPYSAGLADAQKMPGVLVHAQIVSQILSAVLDNRSLIGYWPQLTDILWIWGWSIVGGVLAWRIRTPWKFALAGGATIAVLVGTCYGLFLLAVWIPLVPPALALGGTAIGVVLIDRFNKSAYGQAFYEGVKGVLKLNIEIDQEQKENQVAEITETEYFQTLQQKAKELRNQKNNPSNPSTVPPDDTTEEEITEEVEVIEPDSKVTAEINYFKSLQQKARHLRNQSTDNPTSTPLSPIEDTVENIKLTDKDNKPEPETPEELDYFQSLQQKAKKLKKKRDQSSE